MTEVKTRAKKAKPNFKDETLKYLITDLDLVLLEIKVEETKARFAKGKPEFKKQMPVFQKQLIMLEARKDELMGCIEWVKGVKA